MLGIPSRLNVRPGRGVAFAIHLALSLIIFSSLVAIMLVYWFPGDLFLMDGGWEGLKLVAMVDLVLGPALTLILFKPGKPGLKFDLSVIAAVQIAALAYGFYTTYHQRTVAIVFAENEFATVSAKDKRLSDAQLTELDLNPRPVPRARAFDIPLMLTPAPENYGEYLAQIMNGYPGGHQRSDQYIPVAGNHDLLKPAKHSVAQLSDSGSLALVEKTAAANKLSLDDVEVYRFRARYANGYVLYDPEQSRIVDFIKHGPTTSKSVTAENTE